MNDPKQNLAIFGHAKHGKSTLGGKLACEFGAVSPAQLETFKAIANKQGKDFNPYNSIFLQRNSAVWQKGVDMPGDKSRTTFPEFSNIKIDSEYSISLVDTPGHRDYLSNLIYGVYLADQAILTIAANSGIQDITIEVIKSLISFDIPPLAVVVTKMDIVNYSETVFNEIIDELQLLLKSKFSIDLDDYCANIVPVSSLEDIGFSSFKDQLIWYNGPTLNDIVALQKLKKPDSSSDIKFIIEGSREIYNLESVGVVVVGTLESGELSKKKTLWLEPASTILGKKIEYKIKSIKNAKSVTDKKIIEEQEIYSSRSILSLLLSNASYYGLKKQLKRGGILSDKKVNVVKKMVADISFFEINKIYQGYEFMFHSNACYSSARIETFIELTDAKNLVTNECEISLKNPICIEENKISNRMSKFLLRKDKTIIGCGVCRRIIE